jgi:hypothetical protein
VLLAVSDEPVDKIKEFVKKHGVTYPIISAPEAVKTYEISGFPSKYLVAPSGKVAAGDHFNITAAMIEEQLKNVSSYPQADYSKKFDAALKAVKAEEYGKAMTELQKLDKDEGKDGENAKALEKWIDESGAKKVAEGDDLASKGEVFSARDDYQVVSKKWPAKADYVKQATDKLKALQSDKDAKRVLAQEKTYLQAIEAEKNKDSDKAAKLYAQCAKGAKGTPFGDKCDAKAKSLGGK